MKSASSYSANLIISAIILSVFGIIFIFTASSIPAAQRYGDLFFFPKRQLISLGLGVISGALLLKLPIRNIARLAFPGFILTTLLLVATLIPYFGHTVNGASRWLRWGMISFQPAELSKLVLILFLAKNLARPNFSGLHRLSGLLSCIFPLMVFSILLMLQPDFGTTFLLSLICFSMVFVCGLPIKLVASGLITGLLAIGIAIWQAPYRMKRITSFIDPWESAQSGGFQIIQSYLGFHNGGLLGVGLGGSRQKLYFLPEAHTDFILSVIGEELGLIGVSFIILLFGFMIWNGFKITERQTDIFAKLLAFGLTCLISVQATINMGVAMGLLPTKGMPLPFISHGSSSLVVFLWVVAILARLNYESDHLHERQ
ncbi:putative lipid II flippase FtsW [Pseudobacteriovorax antillogorgiicola]|uniref:Probable peptidoglycan glycosyltransferase FtsW n=1 Tax=Pseudobacteriovorax antillogorgiicola TaxID=1513793 RepID=A0A1Y6BAT2_9BACT|nr:putative lipid II flippase FtsW [Pseudobacteriovorax antillogorgiicola]TCS59166.1 cell division protein FtsW [Pseudobacteriovorax antillogorgiicola]SME91049.1 cell division protein FtsW [Pseudobacteriovorax antillogorgiicola]